MRLREKLKRGFGRRTAIASCLGAGLLVAGGVWLAFYSPTGSADGRGEPGASSSAQAGPGNGGGRRRGDRPGGSSGGPARVQPVKATEARVGDLEVEISALGTVTASNTAIVKARVDGQLLKINFREGQQVKAGDVLAEIDPRPFQIQVDQAHGQRLKDEALLSAAQVDLERYRGLLAKDSIAKQQVDTQEALVRQYRGTVEADKALEANARLQLGFTRVSAPASGRLGLRQVDVGNIVRTADTNGLVLITQTQPIHVVFAIPSESLGDVVGRLQKGESLTVEAWDREGKTRLSAGRLLSVDNQIDVATGTVKLKAEFANADNSLFPNQFVNARLKADTRRDAILLPAAAVQRNAQGPFVYVIRKGEEQTVEPRPLKLGPANGDIVVVEKGLAAGEQVVLDGTDRLRPGGKVDVLSLDGRGASEGLSRAGGEPQAEQAPRRQRSASPRGEGAEPGRRAS